MAVLHFAAVDAMAQRPSGLADDAGGSMPWMITAGIMVLIGIPAFLNPKRSHLN